MTKVRKLAAFEQEKKQHAPLGKVLAEDELRGKLAPIRHVGRGQQHWRSDQEEEEVLDSKTSQRILKLSEVQRREEELAEQEAAAAAKAKRRRLSKEKQQDDSEDEEEEDNIEEENDNDEIEELLGVRHDSDGYVTVVDGSGGLSASEERLVSSMSGAAAGASTTSERRTLADIIMAKIAEKEEADEKKAQGFEYGAEDEEPELPPRVVEVYTDIGRILSRYTAGKLPKAFKVIPSLSNWEDILYLTRPDQWTPQAMYAATRIFASNLNPKMAQRFYQMILLDAVRADIEANHKLNYHYYMSLKKAVYKPAAFFKGILLPLCQDHCTLREAAIVASVLQRVSIPVDHSAAAIHKLSQLEYSGAASIFIKTLLNKKYSLPAPVIGSLVKHFASFTDDTRQLPVLWHQCLLVFVQRYKNEIRNEARESIKILLKYQQHPKITPEIRRELFGIQAFREERGEGPMDTK